MQGSGKRILDVKMFTSLIMKWREANRPGSKADINKLVDETLVTINKDPFIKEICEAFLMSVSIKAARDPNFGNIGNIGKK